MALNRNSPGVVVVDDTSPDILYQPPNSWVIGGVSEEFNATTHGTSSLAATATYHFNGTAIAVYGTTDFLVLSTYVVDELPQVFYNSPDPGLVPERHQLLFYQSPILQDTSHRLVITSLTNRSGSSLWIDYLIYQPSATNISSTQTPSVSSSSSGNGKSDVNVGAIIGGVIGGLAIFAVILALLYIWYRKISAASESHVYTAPPVEERYSNIDPFPLSQPNGRTLDSSYPSNLSGTTAAQGSASKGFSKAVLQHPAQNGRPSQGSLHAHDPGRVSTDPSPSSQNLGAYGSSSAGSSSNVPRHQDGGVRLNEGPRIRPGHSKVASSSSTNTDVPVNVQGPSSNSTESRVENNASGSAGGSVVELYTRATLLSPRSEIPPAYSYNSS